MSSIFRAYASFLHRYPRTCQSLQTGVLMGAGDVLSQTILEKKHITAINPVRTFQFFCVGACFVGPALTVWYATLDKLVGSGGKTVAFKKVALDQLCFAPVCLGLFLGVVNIVQGHSIEETKEAIDKNYKDILIANYKLWPMVQLLNFYIVPLHYQVLYVQTVALFWNTYLCFKTRPNDNI